MDSIFCLSSAPAKPRPWDRGENAQTPKQRAKCPEKHTWQKNTCFPNWIFVMKQFSPSNCEVGMSNGISHLNTNCSKNIKIFLLFFFTEKEVYFVIFWTEKEVYFVKALMKIQGL